MILALETSGRYGSAAIGTGAHAFDQLFFSGKMTHSTELLPKAEELLNKIGKRASDITDVGITLGPGSFTGLRIAVTTAKMMALANNTKICGVNTHDVIANKAAAYVNSKKQMPNRLAIILDAKRGFFFAAVYKITLKGQLERETDSFMITANDFMTRYAQGPLLVTGEGLVYHKKSFENEHTVIMDEEYWSPEAGNVYELTYQEILKKNYIGAEKLTPLYLTRPTAVTKWEKLKSEGKIKRKL